MYQKKRSKFTRKYGKNLETLSKELGVCMATIVKWEKHGFDIFYKAANIIRGNDRLAKVWDNIQSRCGNPNDKAYKYYGGKGIKVKMDKKDLIFLWNRDKAETMKQPSIDRINSNGDYEIGNCRFIEMKENRRKAHEERTEKTNKKWRKLVVKNGWGV